MVPNQHLHLHLHLFVSVVRYLAARGVAVRGVARAVRRRSAALPGRGAVPRAPRPLPGRAGAASRRYCRPRHLNDLHTVIAYSGVALIHILKQVGANYGTVSFLKCKRPSWWELSYIDATLLVLYVSVIGTYRMKF